MSLDLIKCKSEKKIKVNLMMNELL